MYGNEYDARSMSQVPGHRPRSVRLPGRPGRQPARVERNGRSARPARRTVITTRWSYPSGRGRCPVLDRRLYLHLVTWLGQWPAGPGLHVVGSRRRGRPSWDGRLRPAI
ncbi:GNAT family N-acetyltransferase, partial [Micromonospora purpureochromogenes]